MSNRLKTRLEKGLELYQDSIVDTLFVSGGLGKEGHYEAEKMAEFYLDQGVPKTAIIIDNEGNTSQQTADNFAKQFPNQSVIAVTQYHHISRAKLAFRKAGVENPTGAAPRYFEGRDIGSLVREFIGFYKYLLLH